MFSPLSMDMAKNTQPHPSEGVPDPPTEAAHGSGSGGGPDSPAPNTHARPARTSTHSAYVDPATIEMANMRFNETAPPVVSPTSSSPRPAAAVARGGAEARFVPVAASSLGSPGALSRNDHILNRGRQIPYSTLNDVADARHYNKKNDRGAETQQERKHRTVSTHGAPPSAAHATRHRSGTHAASREHKSGKRSTGRHKTQPQRRPQERMRRPLAAMPKFGRPFASNPELPGLESASAAASSATIAYANWNHPSNAKLSASKEAAVPAYGSSASANANVSSSTSMGGGGFGGPQGGSRAGPARLAAHPATRYDSEVLADTAYGKGNGTGKDELAASSPPVKSTSQLQKRQQQQPLSFTSGILDDEGALFQPRHDAHVHYTGGRQREDLSGSSGDTPPNHEAGNGHGGDAARRSHHRHSNRNRRFRNNSEGAMDAGEGGGGGGDEASGPVRTYSVASELSEATHVTRDSFGYPIYHPIFRHGAMGEYDDLDHGRGGGGGARASVAGGGGRPGGVSAGGGGGPPGPTLDVPTTTDVPWDLRNIADKEINKTFAFLSTRYFWFLVEYALRVTCIAMMIPAIIINLNLTYTPFVSTTFALTSVVIAVGTNFGQSCVFFVQYVKGGCIWLPLATICSALKLNRYLGAWFVVYVVLLFLMAMFTEKTTRRMCLLLYNISMVSLLSGDESLVFPTRVLADWALGAAFALVATLIPYPMLATRFSAHITKIMFNNTATCFTGILSCFWAPSNTERSMSMVRIRSLVRTLDHLIEKFDSFDAFTFYEVLIYETSERREVRKEKVKLLLKLKMNLRAMERVINMVQEKPQMIDQSERCQLLRDHLSVPMDDISRSMEALLWKLSAAKKYDQLRTLSGYFEATGRAIKRLQTEFDVGRRVLFYEHQEASILHDGRMEEFVPLMTFFVFSIVNFWTTLEEFESFIDRHKPTNDWKESFKLVWNALIDPFVENAELVRLLCVRREEPEVRVVIEAAKVSVAMLISVIFFYYVDNQSLLLTGPSIIAFVSGTNPVEAVQAGAARMSGTLIGAVLGFFAASLCHTAVDRVAALCVITFAMTFFRPGQKFGTICMYCNFVAVSSLAPTEQTADLTISRIQQNTFAIFIYCFISVAVFPVSPNHVLFKQRMSVMRSLSATVQKLSSLFNDAAHSYIDTRVQILRGAKTEDDVISINHPRNALASNGGAVVPVGQGGNLNNTTIVKVKGLDNSELVVPPSRNNSNMIMPGAFTMAPQDTIVEKIFTDIFVMMDTMKATSSVMPLAADEFQIIPHEYPQRASGDVHAALYRLCALVYTMACAWKTMREKGYFTTDMLHILHNLAPIASDIARCIDRFAHVMEFYVRFPSSGLSSELTKGAMQFRALCVELSARKERDLIAVIRQTILMKRIRDDDSVDEEGTEGGDQEEDNSSSNNNNSNSNSGGGGGNGGEGGDHPPRQRSHLEDWSSQSNRQPQQHHHHGRRNHDTGHRKRSRLRNRNDRHDNGLRHRAQSGGSNKQRRRSSRNHLTSSHNDVAGLADQSPRRDNDRLNASTSAVSQVRSAAPFYSAVAGHEGTPRLGDSTTTSLSTFKDSVIPPGDSRKEPSSSRFIPPVPGDSTWLPVPRSELPEMPGHPPSQHEQDMDTYRHAYDVDEDSVANTSPRSRADGGGTVTNATRVFDPSVFPPPPLDDEQAAAVRRARLEAQLPPSMQGDSVDEHVAVLRQTARAPSTLLNDTDAPPQVRGSRGSGGGGGGDEEGNEDTEAAPSRTHSRYPHAMPEGTSRQSHSTHSSPHTHSHQHHRSSSIHHHFHHSGRHPQRLVAHEECPATKKPSALQRADRLRENLRGFQRQASMGALSRQHSSFEMRTFGASYTNITSMDKAATIVSHNPAHHHSAYTRHQSHHHFSPHQHANGHSHSSLYYEEEEEEEEREAEEEAVRHGRGRRARTANSSSPGLDSSLPYGSREGDLALLEASIQHGDAHEPASLTTADPHTADDIRPDGVSPRMLADAPLPLSSRQGASSSTNHHSQDRITLDQSSSNGDDERGSKDYSSDAGSHSSSSSASSASSSYDSDESGRSEYGSDSDDDYSGDNRSDGSSLVRFNDSFTTPITVQDAEGLHAYTLSLEMFGKELRRVLYGFEEMLQSL